MGVSKYRSWSQSRQNTYDTCPRRWFWEYFPYTEPEEQRACFLKRVQSISELVGSHVHDAIELGLRQFKSTSVWPTKLGRNPRRWWQNVRADLRNGRGLACAVHSTSDLERLG